MRIEKNDLICKWDDTTFCGTSSESSNCISISPTIPIPIASSDASKPYPPKPYV